MNKRVLIFSSVALLFTGVHAMQDELKDAIRAGERMTGDAVTRIYQDAITNEEVADAVVYATSRVAKQIAFSALEKDLGVAYSAQVKEENRPWVEMAVECSVESFAKQNSEGREEILRLLNQSVLPEDKASVVETELINSAKSAVKNINSFVDDFILG